MPKKAFIFFCCLTACLSLQAQVRFAVIPLEFSDCSFSCPQDSLEELCRKSEEYYNKCLHGGDSVRFTLLPLYSSESGHETYGRNGTGSKDERFSELAFEACTHEDLKNDFSKTDHIIFITAGPDEALGASSDWFWPSQEQFPGSMTVVLDGREFKDYAKTCELDSSGRFIGHGLMCHEAGHMLGLPDLYDTDGEKSGGTCSATYGYLSLMDKGDRIAVGHCPPPLNAIELDFLGYGSPIMDSGGSVTLHPVGDTGSYLCFTGEKKGKYHLAENRDGSVLAVYAVDRSEDEAGASDWWKRTLSALERWKLNEVNCNPEHQCAYAVAPPVQTGVSPAYADLGGRLGIRNIRKGQDRCLEMDVVVPIATDTVVPLQQGVTFAWHSGICSTEIKSCVLSVNGSTYADSKGLFYADNLEAGTEYPFSITLETSGGEKYVFRSSVTTLPRYESALPFIYLEGAERNTDGSFKSGQRLRLTVFNAPQHSSLVWYFGGVEVPGDAALVLDRSADLNAVFTLQDGSRKIIRKSIRVE